MCPADLRCERLAAGFPTRGGGAVQIDRAQNQSPTGHKGIQECPQRGVARYTPAACVSTGVGKRAAAAMDPVSRLWFIA